MANGHPGLTTLLHTIAIALALVAGAGGLAALAAGSPLQFGVALALCGAAWIAVDFIDRMPDRAPRRCAIPAVRVVYVGGREQFSRPLTESRRESAARAA